MNLNREVKILLGLYVCMLLFGFFGLFVVNEPSTLSVPLVGLPSILLAYYLNFKKTYINRKALYILMYGILSILVLVMGIYLFGFSDQIDVLSGLFQSILTTVFIFFFVLIGAESWNDNYKYAIFYLMMLVISVFVKWFMFFEWGIGFLYIVYSLLGIVTLYNVFIRYDN